MIENRIPGAEYHLQRTSVLLWQKVPAYMIGTEGKREREKQKQTHTYIQTNKQTNRQTERQTNKHMNVLLSNVCDIRLARVSKKETESGKHIDVRDVQRLPVEMREVFVEGHSVPLPKPTPGRRI